SAPVEGGCEMKDLITLVWKKLRWPEKPSITLTVAVFMASLAAASYAREPSTWPESIIAFGVAVFMVLWTIKRAVLLHDPNKELPPRYILRAKPGPGIDLVIRPVKLGEANRWWWVDGQTEAGRNFVIHLQKAPGALTRGWQPLMRDGQIHS